MIFGYVKSYMQTLSYEKVTVEFFAYNFFPLNYHIRKIITIMMFISNLSFKVYKPGKTIISFSNAFGKNPEAKYFFVQVIVWNPFVLAKVYFSPE